LESLLYIIFFVSCLVLVIAVLLQPGKTDAGALFTSGVSSAALNPRGTQSVLSKITIGAATSFMITALLLSLPALTGNRSVLQSDGADPTPAANTNASVNTNSNVANVNVNAAPSNSNSTTGTNAAAKTEVKKAGAGEDKKDADSSGKKEDADDGDSKSGDKESEGDANKDK